MCYTASSWGATDHQEGACTVQRQVVRQACHIHRGSLGSPRAPSPREELWGALDRFLSQGPEKVAGREGCGTGCWPYLPGRYLCLECFSPYCSSRNSSPLDLPGLGQVHFSWGMPHRGWALRTLRQHWAVKGATRGPKNTPFSSNKMGLSPLCAPIMLVM